MKAPNIIVDTTEYGQIWSYYIFSISRLISVSLLYFVIYSFSTLLIFI